MVPVFCFVLNEAFAAHALRALEQTGRFFGIELLKIFLIGSNVSNFENRKKCSITPPVFFKMYRYM